MGKETIYDVMYRDEKHNILTNEAGLYNAWEETEGQQK